MTSIGSYAFYGCSSLTSITIPDSVTSIGYQAFSGCSSLTSITIPDSITSIGNSAFQYCSSLTGIWVDENNSNYSSDTYGVLFNKEKTELIWAPKVLTEYVIPDSVISIGYYAFSNCSSLTSITIPNGVTSIDRYAFDGCSSLTSITIPDSVTSIGDYAFYGCSSLTSITIPDGVTNIGYRAFYGCSSLTGIWVDENNPNYSSDTYGVLFNKEKTELIWAPRVLTEYAIPDGVTSIDAFAFSNCSGLTSVTIGNSVTSIGNYAFSGCRSLKNVYYDQTQEQWDSISIGYGNSYLTNATLHLHSHSYDTCVVNVQPTFTSEGSQTKTCYCGESITETIPQLVAKVKEWNVALGGDPMSLS